MTVLVSAPDHSACHCRNTPQQDTPGHSHTSVQVSCGVTAPFSWVLVHTGFVCALQESVSTVMCKLCNQIPLASKVKFPGSSQSLCRIYSLGNLLCALELLHKCKNFFGIIVLLFVGHLLYDGANGGLFQDDLCHTPCLPGLMQPEPLSLWQATADPCLHRRHSNTQTQVWLSLLWGLWVLVHTKLF